MILGRAQPELADFGEVFAPEEAAEPILAAPVREALTDWLTEIWAEADLAAVGLAPRRRALFDGPPGVGKTTLAHHLAARLGLQMVAVRPDRIIDKWLGSSAQNLGALFDCAAAAEKGGEPVVLFFDEFDSIAQKRVPNALNAQNEKNAVVNSLLQFMDRHKGFIIAATNHGGQIDQAVWRRFEIQIALSAPGPFERARIIERYLAPYRLAECPLAELSESMETASPALIRAFCESLKRQLIVGPRAGWIMDKRAVIGRLLAAIEPHPELGKPRLWSRGVNDAAVAAMPWPLSTEEPLETEDATAPSKVVALRPATGGAPS